VVDAAEAGVIVVRVIQIVLAGEIGLERVLGFADIMQPTRVVGPIGGIELRAKVSGSLCDVSKVLIENLPLVLGPTRDRVGIEGIPAV